MDGLAFTDLDYTDLLLMDEAERQEVLEDAGFAPDDFGRFYRCLGCHWLNPD